MKKTSQSANKRALRSMRRRQQSNIVDSYYDIIHHAERAHDRRDKLIEHWGGIVVEFSQHAMRAPALASAGSIAAILGFLSANYGKINETNSLYLVNDILLWLLFSALCSVIAPGIAYFSQYFTARSLYVEEYTWKHPYIVNNKWKNFFHRSGNIARYLTYIIVSMAVVFLSIGAYKFIVLINKINI